MNRRSFLSKSFAAASAPLVAPGLLGTLRAATPAPPEGFNEKITADRRAALEILKPSPKVLEHGLALHANSVVVDTYGFGPSAAVDNAALAALINSGASAEEISEEREDMTMTRFVTDAAEQKEYESAWRAAGVTAIIRNSGHSGNDPLRQLFRVARAVSVTDRLRERFSKAVTADDIVAAHRARRHAIMMTTNGVPLSLQWLNKLDELRYVRVFAQLGVRMMHITYNRQNPLGTGCGESGDGGLTDFGRDAVAELNRQGVLADVAHSSLKTSFDTAKVSKKPMVASHTTAAALQQHIRAKTDEVLKAIADTDGLIGICCIHWFLGRTNDINALLDHIDYVVKKVGVDHVGIGTDVGYASQLKPAGRLPARPPTRAGWEALWPPGSRRIAVNPRAEASLAWTNWPMFTVGLVQRGYSDTDIQKIIGGNMLRVLRANEPSGATNTGRA